MKGKETFRVYPGTPFCDIGECPYREAIARCYSRAGFWGWRPSASARTAPWSVPCWRRCFTGWRASPSRPGGACSSTSPPRSYCAQAADWCACQGILPGLGQGRFFPGRAVSWEELLLALWRWEGCPGGGEAPGEIWARARGFALPEDLFRPLSRGEAAQAVDSFFLPQ